MSLPGPHPRSPVEGFALYQPHTVLAKSLLPTLAQTALWRTACRQSPWDAFDNVRPREYQEMYTRALYAEQMVAALRPLGKSKTQPLSIPSHTPFPSASFVQVNSSRGVGAKFQA